MMKNIRLFNHFDRLIEHLKEGASPMSQKKLNVELFILSLDSASLITLTIAMKSRAFQR